MPMSVASTNLETCIAKMGSSVIRYCSSLVGRSGDWNKDSHATMSSVSVTFLAGFGSFAASGCLERGDS